MITVYPSSAFHSVHAQLLCKFATGIPDAILSDSYVPSDIAVIFGMYKIPQTNSTHRLKKYILDNTKNVIIVETPLLGREVQPHNAVFPYYRVGINHVVNTIGEFNIPDNPSYFRWRSMKEKLNIKLKPWRTGGNNILVVLQLLRDSSLRGANHIQWAVDIIKKLKQSTNKNIVVKIHPLTNDNELNIITTALTPLDIKLITNTSKLEDRFNCLEDCWATVTYCSGFAIDSIIQGIPTIACDKGSFAYNIISSVSDIDNIILPDRDKWLAGLSYAQWTEDEMQQGVVWNHLKGKINV